MTENESQNSSAELVLGEDGLPAVQEQPEDLDLVLQKMAGGKTYTSITEALDDVETMAAALGLPPDLPDYLKKSVGGI